VQLIEVNAAYWISEWLPDTWNNGMVEEWNGAKTPLASIVS